MKKPILTCFFLLSFTALALKTESINEEKITIKVSGMVCNGCVRVIKNAFKKNKAIKSIKNIDVSRKDQTVKITTNGQVIRDDILREIIKEAGYSVININRKIALNQKNLLPKNHPKKG